MSKLVHDWHTSNFTTTTGKLFRCKSKNVKLHLPIVITCKWFSNSQHLTVKMQNLSPCRHDVKGHVGDKLTHALFDCCARGLRFNGPLQPWTFLLRSNRNDDSVILFVPNVCGHVFPQHLSHGKDQYFLARFLYTVDLLCSHEVRILAPGLLFSHVISGQMDPTFTSAYQPWFLLQFLCPCIFS